MEFTHKCTHISVCKCTYVHAENFQISFRKMCKFSYFSPGIWNYINCYLCVDIRLVTDINVLIFCITFDWPELFMNLQLSTLRELSIQGKMMVIDNKSYSNTSNCSSSFLDTVMEYIRDKKVNLLRALFNIEINFNVK